MSRKPKDTVAASTTASLRLTPDDRARIVRLIEARADELPERSLSALFRRLVRDAEGASTIRLPPEETALLSRLVEARSASAARIGAIVTPVSLVCGVIRDLARAEGLDAPAAPQAIEAPTRPAAPTTPETGAEGKAQRREDTAPNAAHVKAALLAALAAGQKQADIAKKAGIDSGHLSRFKAKGSGLSPESLGKLAKVVGTSAG